MGVIERLDDAGIRVRPGPASAHAQDAVGLLQGVGAAVVVEPLCFTERRHQKLHCTLILFRRAGVGDENAQSTEHMTERRQFAGFVEAAALEQAPSAARSYAP
jgi:hypothetical protein